ncbi:hypothetical protein GCM10023160_05890 [Brachybacterium paraconglomeratum]
MIRYDEVADLTGEQAQRVRALIDRSSEIWDMPDDLDTIRAWEEQIAACEAEGVPHLAASARFGQYAIYSLGGMPAAALDAYVRLMQIVGRYGDHINPENRRGFLGAVADLVVTVSKDPSLARPQLERIVDLVEQQTVKHGDDLAHVTLARASLAVEFGEQERALALLDQWQGIGSPDWPPFDANTVTREIMLLERFDPALAAATLARRFTAMGVPPGPIDMDRRDSIQLVLLRTDLGSLSARAGQKDVAARIGDELVAQFGIDRLVRSAEIQDLLLVLEHRPDEARIAADFGLENSSLDLTEWRLQAALARSRALEDPTGEEAQLLRALATEAAAAHDARGGTDGHTRELQDIWFADLAPATPVTSGADADPEAHLAGDERVRTLLAQGLLRGAPRTGEVGPGGRFRGGGRGDRRGHDRPQPRAEDAGGGVRRPPHARLPDLSGRRPRGAGAAVREGAERPGACTGRRRPGPREGRRGALPPGDPHRPGPARDPAGPDRGDRHRGDRSAGRGGDADHTDRRGAARPGGPPRAVC